MNDSNDKSTTDPLTIGGGVSKAQVEPGLIPAESNILTERQRDRLWELLIEIGQNWRTRRGAYDTANLRSSWLEFIDAKTSYEPSYVGEYINAAEVLNELIDMYGRDAAYSKLFFESGIEPGSTDTRIGHLKRFVVDEFIRMHITAGGHKSFGGENYHGYLGGSRYTRTPRVRAYARESEFRNE